MNFKNMKDRLLGKKFLNEGTGFVRLKNRLNEATEEIDEAEFPWHKFPAPKGGAPLPIGKKGEKSISKPNIFPGMGVSDKTDKSDGKAIELDYTQWNMILDGIDEAKDVLDVPDTLKQKIRDAVRARPKDGKKVPVKNLSNDEIKELHHVVYGAASDDFDTTHGPERYEKIYGEIDWENIADW